MFSLAANPILSRENFNDTVCSSFPCSESSRANKSSGKCGRKYFRESTEDLSFGEIVKILSADQTDSANSFAANSDRRKFTRKIRATITRRIGTKLSKTRDLYENSCQSGMRAIKLQLKQLNAHELNNLDLERNVCRSVIL